MTEKRYIEVKSPVACIYRECYGRLGDLKYVCQLNKLECENWKKFPYWCPLKVMKE